MFVLVCSYCQQSFDCVRRVQSFCSQKCGHSSRRILRTKICQNCQKEIICRSKTKRFCNKSCSNAWQHANGIRRAYVNDKTFYEWWLFRHGKEVADQKWNEWTNSISESTSGEKNPMFGRNDQCHGLKRFQEENAGKSLEEKYGLERAAKMRRDLSERNTGEKNPAYGKVYSNGGKSVKGWYKGYFFRSLLEYSFMKHQEQLGRVLGKDFIPYEISIPYFYDGANRTYRPDFIVHTENCVYEIKQSYAISRPENVAKFAAGAAYCEACNIEYRVITELEFKKIPFDEAKLNNEIVWSERTLSYFKSSS